MYDWAFQFGPGLVVGFGNGLMLGYLMYRSGLVPPRMAILGLIGGPMLIISFVLILFGAYENGSGPSGLMALPEIVWEASLAIYCVWKGFLAEPDLRAPGDDGIAEPQGVIDLPLTTKRRSLGSAAKDRAVGAGRG